jgi:hypothetical protein
VWRQEGCHSWWLPACLQVRKRDAKGAKAAWTVDAAQGAGDAVITKLEPGEPRRAAGLLSQRTHSLVLMHQPRVLSSLLPYQQFHSWRRGFPVDVSLPCFCYPGTAYALRVRLGTAGSQNWSGLSEWKAWGEEHVYQTSAPAVVVPKQKPSAKVCVVCGLMHCTHPCHRPPPHMLGDGTRPTIAIAQGFREGVMSHHVQLLTICWCDCAPACRVLPVVGVPRTRRPRVRASLTAAST